MFRFIGIIELSIYYVVYMIKLLNQKKIGIKTNQLGIGSKPRRTILLERLLRFISLSIVIIMLVSMIADTSFITEPGIRIAGFILFGLGTITFIIAMITMKNNWRAGIPDKDKTEMVTAGIYRISRNPAFLGFDLTYIGVSLTFSNVILILTAVIAIVLMHLQILEEEKFLQKTFGSQYIAYKKKVGRYFKLR